MLFKGVLIMSNIKKILGFSLCFVLLINILAGCNADETSSPNESTPETSQEILTEISQNQDTGTNNESETTAGTENQGSSEGLAFLRQDNGQGYECFGIGDCTDKDIVISTYNGLPVTSIRPSAFENCTQLTSVTIADSSISIGENAFKGCTNLTQATLPASVTAIVPSAFVDTPIYNDSANWENHMFYIGTHLIYADIDKVPENCVIRDGTTTIVNEAFLKCNIIKSITFPDSLRYIGVEAFRNCQGLTNVVIPHGVIEIRQEAFVKCDHVTSFTIPSGVTYIGPFAFANGDSLSSIILGNVSNVDSKAFVNAFELTDIYFVGTEEEWNNLAEISKFNFSSTPSVHFNYTP